MQEVDIPPAQMHRTCRKGYKATKRGGGEVIGEGDIGSRAEVDTHGRAPDKFLYSFTRRCSNKKKFKFITRTRTRTCNAQTHARAHINTRTRTGARIYTA